ncbi:hypothetical protein V2A60_005664 [Cordyceps javanica]
MPLSQGPRVAQQLRPNGSQAACDPCRARKVACDHARPACSRCRAKNRGNECFYSANATRKVKVSESLLPSPSDAPSVALPPRPAKRQRPNIRLGYTSALEETQPNLLGTMHSNLYGHVSPTIHPEPNRRVVFSELPGPVRETCMAVLRALPNQRDAQMVYIEGEFQAKGWLHLAAHRIVRWLQTVLAESPSRRMPVWEAHGANVNYMIYLGLHTQDLSTPYVPTAWSENNRRMAAATFVSDKIGVMLTGNPPLISHHYYTAPLPLDLRDEDLIAGSTTLNNAINSLDERGWNTDGGLYPATVARARTMMALIRDEVIEVTMSNGRDPSLEYLMDLKDREYSLVAEFPTSLRYDSRDLEVPNTDTHALYMKILTHLEHLQNLFFIDRLLIRCRYAIRDNLLETSLALANLALHLWIHKDQFTGTILQRSFEWIMLSFGAPAAGILCQEVLGAGEHSKDPNISRATVIQQLSLLVGFFDWVRPSMPNAKLCANCKAIIQQVLDQCLNTSPEAVMPAFPAWDLGDQPDFNFELMDTFDWLRAADC